MLESLSSLTPTSDGGARRPPWSVSRSDHGDGRTRSGQVPTIEENMISQRRARMKGTAERTAVIRGGVGPPWISLISAAVWACDVPALDRADTPVPHSLFLSHASSLPLFRSERLADPAARPAVRLARRHRARCACGGPRACALRARVRAPLSSAHLFGVRAACTRARACVCAGARPVQTRRESGASQVSQLGVRARGLSCA
jgi:hypothetical protein